MPTKKLTEEARRELKKPLGLLLLERENKTIEQLKQILKGHKTGKTIVVGDYTARGSSITA